MEATKTLILDPTQCRQKIDRIAHEINENFDGNEVLFVVGIAKRGYTIAEKIVSVLEKVSTFRTSLVKLEMNKDTPLSSTPVLEIPLDELNGGSVVLVDDVLNSGKTLIYAVAHLLEADPKLIKTVTMVDRRHRRYPVKADYVGLTLSTTLREHISVEFKGSDIEVYLK